MPKGNIQVELDMGAFEEIARQGLRDACHLGNHRVAPAQGVERDSEQIRDHPRLLEAGHRAPSFVVGQRADVDPNRIRSLLLTHACLITQAANVSRQDLAIELQCPLQSL